MTAQHSAFPSTLRILIADDSVETADSVAQVIRLSMACEIEVVYGGSDALRRAIAQRPDAVILDLHMPTLDGLDVARSIRRHYRNASPYIVAVTGRFDMLGDLPAIDDNFDQALAKPLDVDALVTVLARLAAGNVHAPRARVAFDLAELFTRAARQVMPMAVAKGLSVTFDYRGPAVIVEDDPVEVQCAFHRLMLALVDFLQSGFVLFNAEARVEADGHCTISVNAGGSGVLRPAAEVNAVLGRLGLHDVLMPDSSQGEIHSAVGVCPNTGAPVTFAGDEKEGVLLRTELSYPHAEDDGLLSAAWAPGGRAWIVDSGDVGAASLARRLQRLGWSIFWFSNCFDAIHQAATEGEQWPATAPGLLIVVESWPAQGTNPTNPKNAASAADRTSDRTAGLRADVQALQRRMPASTQRVYAVVAGSPTLGEANGMEGYTTHVLPFSPQELADFCSLSPARVPRRESRFGALGLMGDPATERPTVLLVDDNEINRIVGRGLIEALDYEVRTAHDGLDAIDTCRRLPPQLVLMDLDMPVLGGIEATLRLRELQRNGVIAPFAIIAATSDATAAARQACVDAGMDGFMTKPLSLDRLRHELKRFISLV